MKKDYLDIIDKVAEMYDEGYSASAVAEHFGLHKSVAARLIKSKTTWRSRYIGQKDKELFYEMYCKGYGVVEIAKKTKKSYTVVAKALKDYGIGSFGNNRKFEKLREDFIKDYKAGLSLSEIGKKYGVARTTVHTYLMDDDVERRSTSESSRSYQVDDHYFDNLDATKYYVLGRVFALGGIYSVNLSYYLNVRVDKKNVDIALDTIKYFSRKGVDNIYYNKQKCSTNIRINSKTLYNKLSELHMGEYIPERLKNEDFWRGFLDASLRVGNTYISIKCSYYYNDIYNLFISLGIKADKIKLDGKSTILIRDNKELIKILDLYNFKDKIIKYLENNESTKWTNFIVANEKLERIIDV